MPSAIAIAAHPDDIEFVMAGTLLLLANAGWEIHYLNLSSGNLGSMQHGPHKTARLRREEARKAAKVLNATWHAPFCDDLEIFYDKKTLRRLCAIIREVDPAIVLTHSPQDYMEDHMNTSRLAVTAAFGRGMPNFRSEPPRKPATSAVTLYHASPHGLHDGLRRRIVPGSFVDTSSVQEQKRASLACHASQKEWLDKTQGLDSYLHTMDEFSLELGRLSGEFQHAEGWRRHSHLGFSPKDHDPLAEVLEAKYKVNHAYERELEVGSGK